MVMYKSGKTHIKSAHVFLMGP